MSERRNSCMRYKIRTAGSGPEKEAPFDDAPMDPSCRLHCMHLPTGP